jgi:hypothetical protein
VDQELRIVQGCGRTGKERKGRGDDDCVERHPELIQGLSMNASTNDGRELELGQGEAVTRCEFIFWACSSDFAYG